MARVVLLHWKASECAERAQRIERAGHEVRCESEQGGGWYKTLRDDPPDAVVIDLSRLPSHGRESGAYLRRSRATRHVPIVFVDGAEDKVAQTKKLMPDATYCAWRGIKGAIARAIRNASDAPVVPGTMDGYSGTPLGKKLGVKAGCRLALLGAPKGFAHQLAPMPEGVRIVTRAGPGADVALLFVTARSELARRWAAAARSIGGTGRLWVCWPKKSAGVESDLTQNDVRAFGLERGLVDFKICAIDATWSGLAFTTRKR